MDSFETYEDVEDWLAPMGFDAFWAAMLKIGLYGPGDRDHCRAALAKGHADMETVMGVTKRMALMHLVDQFNLPFRCELPARVELAVIE